MSDGIDAVLDGDSSGLESLYKELGIPLVRTLGVQRSSDNENSIE